MASQAHGRAWSCRVVAPYHAHAHPRPPSVAPTPWPLGSRPLSRTNEPETGAAFDGDSCDNDDGASNEEGAEVVSVCLRLGAILRYTINYTK